jgi:hypothetical protein
MRGKILNNLMTAHFLSLVKTIDNFQQKKHIPRLLVKNHLADQHFVDTQEYLLANGLLTK